MNYGFTNQFVNTKYEWATFSRAELTNGKRTFEVTFSVDITQIRGFCYAPWGREGALAFSGRQVSVEAVRRDLSRRAWSAWARARCAPRPRPRSSRRAARGSAASASADPRPAATPGSWPPFALCSAPYVSSRDCHLGAEHPVKIAVRYDRRVEVRFSISRFLILL